VEIAEALGGLGLEVSILHTRSAADTMLSGKPQGMTWPLLQLLHLQVLRFTTTYLQSVLAGQLGRFALLASVAHVPDLLSKIDEPGNGHEQRAPNAVCTVKGQTP
jgi:hypothetical protein